MGRLDAAQRQGLDEGPELVAARVQRPAGSVGNVPAFCCAPGMDAVAMTSARVALSHRSAMSESFARTAMDQTRRFNRRYTASC
jgi:hypothetical protein